MRGRAVVVVGSVLAIAACGVDPIPGPGPTVTTAQLAHAFDSLAGVLPPGDPRIHWLQQIDNALALGAARTPIQIDAGGKSDLYWAVVTATIATLDSTGPPREVDSTYVLTAWEGGLEPINYLELDISFIRRTYSQPDSTASQVSFFMDSAASGLIGASVVGAVQNTLIKGQCTPVTLVHLFLPTGHCGLISTQIGYQSSIGGMPFRLLNGARLTPTH